MVLSAETVSPAFIAFFSIWATLTPQIQALPADQQHDLARVICGHEPLSPAANNHETIRRMALDLRAVAIEISQRRTFQERYQADLQAALDHGTVDGRRTPSPMRATFQPPPGYEMEKPLPLSPPLTPQRGTRPLPTSPPAGRTSFEANTAGPSSPSGSRHPSPNRGDGSLAASGQGVGSRHTRVGSASSGQFLVPPASAGPSRQRSASPSILTAHDPAILTIRETLYAALADVLARTPEVRGLLKTDPPRAYFASVGLAILDFSLKSISPEGNVRAVLGNDLRLEDIPRNYVPLMQELQAIATRSVQLEEEDNTRAIELLTAGEDTLPEPRMDRVRRMLIKGVARGWEELRREGPAISDEEADVMAGAAFESQERRSARDPNVVRGRSRDRSPEGTVLQLTNRINALALAMTRLPAFRERQNQVFKVLAGVR